MTISSISIANFQAPESLRGIQSAGQRPSPEQMFSKLESMSPEERAEMFDNMKEKMSGQAPGGIKMDPEQMFDKLSQMSETERSDFFAKMKELKSSMKGQFQGIESQGPNNLNSDLQQVLLDALNANQDSYQSFNSLSLGQTYTDKYA